MNALSNILKTPLSEEQKNEATKQIFNERKTPHKVVWLDLGPDDVVNERFYNLLKEKIHKSRIILSCSGSKKFREKLSFKLPRVFDYILTEGYLIGAENSVKEYISKLSF